MSDNENSSNNNSNNSNNIYNDDDYVKRFPKGYPKKAHTPADLRKLISYNENLIKKIKQRHASERYGQELQWTDKEEIRLAQARIKSYEKQLSGASGGSKKGGSRRRTRKRTH